MHRIANRNLLFRYEKRFRVEFLLELICKLKLLLLVKLKFGWRKIRGRSATCPQTIRRSSADGCDLPDFMGHPRATNSSTFHIPSNKAGILPFQIQAALNVLDLLGGSVDSDVHALGIDVLAWWGRGRRCGIGGVGAVSTATGTRRYIRAEELNAQGGNWTSLAQNGPRVKNEPGCGVEEHIKLIRKAPRMIITVLAMRKKHNLTWIKKRTWMLALLEYDGVRTIQNGFTKRRELLGY
ncbi:hypothetical protein B0H13DRAFT_1862367 [Mycena leptocephala]|nr:hypothetical protein B0H13DRAFT_1862367 [Mycena leptocephala]